MFLGFMGMRRLWYRALCGMCNRKKYWNAYKGTLDKVEIRKSFKTTLDQVNATLESHEKLSNVVIADEGWTIENDLLTPTLKVKRDKLEEKYNAVIAQTFSDAIAWES